MSDGPRAPRLTDKQLLFVRFAAVLVSYGVYRLIEPRRLMPAIFLGVGTLIVLYKLIDRFGAARKDRLELLEIGSIILGAGLLGLGAYLALR